MKPNTKRYRILIALLLCMTLCAALAGCGEKKDSSEKPDLSSLGEVQTITREDGSGTKEQFDTLLDTSEKSTDVTAYSTEEVIDNVKKNPSAVGYVALSALPKDPGVKVLSIDQVKASASTLKSGKYPLTRHYYLAWLGDPSGSRAGSQMNDQSNGQSDLQREFLTYVTGAGQKYVKKEAVAVSKETSFLSTKPTGSIRIAGSTSMTPLMHELAKGYESYNPNARITVAESDSTKGLIAAMQGKTDFAMSSRDLKDYEQNVLSSKAIALDGIAVIVNPKNPLTNLSKSDVKKLFDGSAKNWSDL